MTQNRRIVLNIVATYGRSLYALVLGLFTARWVLMSLGQVDYGLFGVVGEMVGRWLGRGENGKIYGNVMNVARQISRRFDRSTGARTRSAADYFTAVTLSVVYDPLKAHWDSEK